MNDESYEYEGRRYMDPNVSLQEQTDFIKNLRDIQSQNNAQISEQTFNLGTDVPSNLGGLGGGDAYFMSRYQTPQVEEMTATLKSAAQAQALNDVMKNYQNQLNNRYKQAYRNHQKRQRAKARAASSSGSNVNSGANVVGDNIEITDNGKTILDTDKTITTTPIEGHTTTSYYDGTNWVTVDETTGDRYINGKKVN